MGLFDLDLQGHSTMVECNTKHGLPNGKHGKSKTECNTYILVLQIAAETQYNIQIIFNFQVCCCSVDRGEWGPSKPSC